MKKTPFIIYFVFFLIMGCEYASEDDLINSEIEQPALVNYNDNIKSIIDNNCVICHNNPPLNGATTSLVNYQNVVDGITNNNLINRISIQTGETGAMPLGGPRLPQNLIDLIQQWQEDGLPEN